MHGQQRNSSTAERVGRRGADGAARSNGSRGLASGTRRQLVLREVNERIRELAGEVNETGVSLFVCECSRLSCADALEMSEAEYARVRADESQFLVFPGHELSESQRVVARTDRFVVVANRGPEDGQPRRSEGRGDG
jgi:hypothetical protein